MSDELQIQQGSSSTPYALTGAIIGGAAGGAGAHFLTRPKYGSYEDIIKEAKDSTDFSSKIEKAEGKEKEFLQAAKDIAGKRTEAEAEYNKMFEDWKKEHPNTAKVETDEYKALKEAQKKAEADLEAKKKSLVDEEFNRIKNSASKSSITGAFDAAELPTLINDATEKRQRDFYAKLEVYANKKQALLDKLDAAVAANDKALEKQINNEINAFEKQIQEELNTEVSSWYKNPKAKASKRAINDTVDKAILTVSTRVQEKDYSRVADAQLSTLEKQIKDKISANGSESLNTLVEQQKGNIDGINRALEHKIRFNRKQINILETVQKNYEKMLKEAGTAESEAEQIVKHLKIAFGLIEKTETVTPGKALPKEFKQFVEGLSDKEKEAVGRMLKDGEFTVENLDKAVKDLQQKTRALTEVYTRDIPNFNEKIKEKGGSTFIDGVLRDKEGNVIDLTTKRTFAKPDINIPRASVADVKKSFETGEVKALTDEEIRKQAEAAVKESAYQKETNAVAEAKKKAEEAFGKLADGEALTAEQQEAAFLKDKGIESKTKFLDGKVEEASKNFKTNFKEWIERKWGFAEHTNAKIAGVALAGALVIGGLASAMAPKNRG